MNRLGIVTGMASEAECLARHASPEQPLIRCAGASAERAYASAHALAARGATVLVSFGIAGALDPALRPGDLLLPEAVKTAAECAAAHPDWRAALAAALKESGSAAAAGSLWGSETPIANSADKAALRAMSGCVAVDMESHAVAAAAREAGLPFLALRVVADPAERSLPRSVENSLTPEGRQRALLVMARLSLRVWEIPSVIVLGRDYRAAMRVLGSVAAPALLRAAVRGVGV